MNKQITVLFDAENSPRFPLYCQYGGQLKPQDAFIELDLRTGNIDAKYTGIVGYALPEDVYHGTRLWFYICPHLKSDQIAKIINDHLSELEHLYQVSDILWDGNNWFGGASDDSGIDSVDWSSLVENLRHKLHEATNDYENLIVDSNDFAEWAYAETLQKGDARAIAYELIQNQGEYYYFHDSINDVDSIAELIEEIWSDKED